MISGDLYTKLPKSTTQQPTAWQNGEFETVRLNYTLPAVRIHEHYAHRRGRFFAVDEYNLSISAYQNRYALLAKHKRPKLEIFLLAPRTIVNVGKARRQGEFSGGGLQFEVLEGSPDPVHIKHEDVSGWVQY